MIMNRNLIDNRDEFIATMQDIFWLKKPFSNDELIEALIQDNFSRLKHFQNSQYLCKKIIELMVEKYDNFLEDRSKRIELIESIQQEITWQGL